MSFGSLGANAIAALNKGAKSAECFHNTGEGGVSPYHANGDDIVWQIGTGYFGARDENGHFSVQDIPPGTYDLRAWHPGIKPAIKQQVTIEPGGQLTVDFVLPSPGRKKTALTVRTPPRFTPAALGREFTIEPILERQ